MSQRIRILFWYPCSACTKPYLRFSSSCRTNEPGAVNRDHFSWPLIRTNVSLIETTSFQNQHSVGHSSAMATPPSPPSPVKSHDDYRTSLNIAILECRNLQELIRNSSKLSPELQAFLISLIQAELVHLSRRLFHCDSSNPSLCSNVGHFSVLCHVIHHPEIQFVSAVSTHVGSNIAIHVDVMCSFRRDPIWVFVSDQSPNSVSWAGSPCGKDKGLRGRVENAIVAASGAGHLRPSKILFVFSRGLEEEERNKFLHEFGAVESDFSDEMDDEWLGISDDSKRLLNYKAFEIQIIDDHVQNVSVEEQMARTELDLSVAIESKISTASSYNDGLGNVINFDITVLIAMVSGISNGYARRLQVMGMQGIKEMFKSNYEYVNLMVNSEFEQPILEELNAILAGKKGIVCQSVLEEFKEVVSKCGGPGERYRARDLETTLVVVPDNPSERVMSLPATATVDPKNQIIFGTGDHWRAPTLTAKKNVVRAIAQTGMSLLTIVHRPRILLGV